MARTLSQILIDANAHLDLEATLPTSTELTLRTNFANQSIWDAAATGQLKEFKKVYEVNTSTLASIPMPSDFREFQSVPRILSGGSWVEYEEIEPEQKYEKANSDRYCYVLGNPVDGYTAVFNSIISMATLSFVYQRFPSGLATLTDTCELPDPQYVVSRTVAYVLEARSDDRFPLVKADSEIRLKNMSGRNMKRPGGGVNQTPRVRLNPLS